MAEDKIEIDLNQADLDKAIGALLKHVKQKNEKHALFLNEGERVLLQFTFKLIPRLKGPKTIKVDLPHEIKTDNTEVCLFVKDVDAKSRDYAPSVKHYEALLREKGVTSVAEVIPLKRLKLEYKEYEARKNLSNMFGIFLADEAIVRLLPGLLGKHFYKRKKNPTPVNMTAKNLKGAIEKAVGGTRCILTGHGSSFAIVVGHTEMKAEELRENIEVATQKLADSIPGGAINVKNIHLKTIESVSLPLYISLGDKNHVKLPKKIYIPEVPEPEDVTTVENARVKVSRYGNIDIVYPGPGETFDEPIDDTPAKKPKKTKKRKSSSVTENEKTSEAPIEKKTKTVTEEDEVTGSEPSKVKKHKTKTPKAEMPASVKKASKSIKEETVFDESETVEVKKKDKIKTPKSAKKIKVEVSTPKSSKKHEDIGIDVTLKQKKEAKTPKSLTKVKTPKSALKTPKSGKKK
ncbi:unnamed protein product [Owenia fusiformis]|uniref:Ribosomal L1 domain-containing protein 1 n=1 Tax=Owenia fusiformis TaxID=6347 RepID=A0A8J1U8V2_OWEFU|nr:unnamed protein product [Owenia fusiformis]